jgi:hypothetical protein
MKKIDKIILFFLSLSLIAVSGIVFYFWIKIKSFEPIVFHYVPPERSFIYSEEEFVNFGIENCLRETISNERKELINKKESFINVDLQKMELTLYKEGEKYKTFPVKAKGVEWFWGETPPGVYKIEFKSPLLFSNVARVWMPYAMRFFGNYFIHGWPYDRTGRLLTTTYSGGCIRLRTEDAAEVFEFVKEGMSVLIFDEKARPPLPALNPISKKISPPELKADSFLVADLDTGEIILEKERDLNFYSDVISNLMLAIVASESINLDKRIIAQSWMFERMKEGLIISGRSYQGKELVHILISKSSKEAALVLSRFLSPEILVQQMNKKAKALGMKNTNFDDVVGISEKNITTLYDTAKMMRYIKDYKNFIFKISEEFLGKGENEKETIVAVLKMNQEIPEEIKNKENSNIEATSTIRFIFIGIANSQNTKEDFKNILNWLTNNFSLKRVQ